MLRAWLGDMRITAADRRWGNAMEHYIRNEDEDLPPIDRFNLGQKYFFWAMLCAGVVLLISGVGAVVPGAHSRAAGALRPRRSCCT